MNKPSNPTNQGFSLVVIIIIIAAIIATVIIVWRVYGQGRQDDAVIVDDKNNKQPQPASPYAGWKTYCDTKNNACFKHPEDWVVKESELPEHMVGFTTRDPENKIQGRYVYGDSRDNAPTTYYVSILQHLKNYDYSIIGGYDVDFTSPELKIVDKYLTEGLTVGEKAIFGATNRFTFKDRVHGTFSFKPTNRVGLTATQAQAWFTSDDAKTALLILESFNIK